MEDNKLDALTAAPVTMEINGKEEKLYPLRFSEWGELERWMRQQIILTARDSIEGLSEKDALIIMKSAHQAASQVSVLQSIRSQEDGALAYLKSFEGMLRALHLSLRTDGSEQAKPKYEFQVLQKSYRDGLTKLTNIFITLLDISFPEIFGKALEEVKSKN